MGTGCGIHTRTQDCGSAPGVRTFRTQPCLLLLNPWRCRATREGGGWGGAFLRAMRGGGREGVFCVCLSSSAAQCEQPREPVMFPPQLCIRGSEKKQIIPAWRCIKRSSEYFLQIHLFKTEARKYTLLLPFPPTSQLTSPFGALPSQMLESRALSPKHER